MSSPYDAALAARDQLERKISKLKQMLERAETEHVRAVQFIDSRHYTLPGTMTPMHDLNR